MRRIGDGRMYRLLGKNVDGESGWILDSVVVSETPGCETLFSSIRKLSWYEMTLHDEEEGEKTHRSKGDENRSSVQSPHQVLDNILS